MRAAPHPQNAQRLELLEGYGILNTGPELDFDEIVALASEICDAPITLVSLVEEDRQWFKAETGFGQSETPIDQAICAHTILQDEILEIPDTQADPRTRDNPLCIGDEAARFYAGAPLIAHEGMAIGSLCVLDNKPRVLTPLQRKTLKVLSRQVMKLIEQRKLLHTQKTLQAEADHRVKNSLQSMSAIVRVYARTITDEAALEALGAIQRRIDAVAALHQELQGHDGRDTVDTNAYLSSVMSHLRDTAPANVTMDGDFASIILRSSHAANLAMIISEFVANSIKHAFPDDREGAITIALSIEGPSTYRLVCRDNGIGANAPQTAKTRTQGIGLSLVSAAASNLSGKTQSDLTPDGSHLVLEFQDQTVADTFVAE